jgi:calcineurin-like phosphoesterase family protein
MTTVFFIGDTHFGHKNIVNSEKMENHRPFATIEEHDAKIIENWNSVVGENDIVWHLGDVCFGRRTLEIVMPQLKGIKKLVIGNHEYSKPEAYAKHFESLHGAVKFNEFVLTHIPVHPNQFPRFSANIHGHMHSYYIEKNFSGKLVPDPDPRYVCVSAEQINYTPISLEEIRKRIGGTQ